MESFDYSKVIWAVLIAAYFGLQWMGRKARAAESHPPIEDSQEQWQEQWGSAADVEPITRATPRPITRSVPKRDRVEPPTESIEEAKKEQKSAFDLRRAVIMSEILAPKFREK